MKGKILIFDDPLFPFRTFHGFEGNTHFGRMSCFGTFYCFEANSHVEPMLSFGTWSAFVTFHRFESMILADFLYIFCFRKNMHKTFQEILRNKNIFKLVTYVLYWLSDFKTFQKNYSDHSPKIVIFNSNEIVFWLVFLVMLNLLKCYKIRTCYENETETWIRDICTKIQNWYCSENVTDFFKEMNDLPQFWF